MIYLGFGLAFFFLVLYIVSTYQLDNMIAAFKVYEKEVDKLVKGVNASYKQAELLGSVKERFKIFSKLTESQRALLGQVDQPSINASHSRFKNSVIRDLKQIEEDKKEVLQSILDDGIDVHISIMDTDGEITKVLISEFLSEQFQSSENTESNIPQKVERNLRLVEQPLELVKEENIDDTNGSEIH